MKRLLLCVLLIWTVSGNPTYDASLYSFDSDYYDEYSTEAIDFKYNDNYTNCNQVSNTISCNVTLNAQNFKEYIVSSLNAPPPVNPKDVVDLNCVFCDLETFPNEIVSDKFRWRTLNFANSNIKHLKMNVGNSKVANTLHKLYLRNNSIKYLDHDSFPTSYKIIAVDLSHNMIANVAGIKTFSKLKNLMRLNLAHNFITYLDPLVFKALTYLRRLELNNNMLLETSFMCYLNGHRTVLTLSNNPYIYLEPDIDVNERNLWKSPITNCSIGTSIESLVIANGFLQAIDLSNATRVRLVNLSSNHLKYFEFKNPESLRVLDLYDNKLEAFDIGHPWYLRSVNLGRNNFTDTLNMSLPKRLQDLNLSHNKIANFAPETFKNLSLLSRLNLAHCELTTLNANLLIPLQNLRYLDLSYNRFVSIDLNIFNGLKLLLEVNLNGNRLTDINVEDLQNKTKLGLWNNDWKCTRLKMRSPEHINKQFIYFFIYIKLGRCHLYRLFVF